MKRICLLLLLASITPMVSACSSADTSPTAGNVDSNGNAVSSVPWNKPESWETNGQVGQALSQ
jgi:hypothetical protein